MDDDQLHFAIFCVEAIAEYLRCDPRDVFDALTVRTNLLYDYVVRNYDTLHTQDKVYIVQDVLNELAHEGVIL